MSRLSDPILVTGSAGFIGSHLAEALVKKAFKVRALVHYNFQNNWGWLEEILGERIKKFSKKTDLGVLYEYEMNGGFLEVLQGDIQDPFFVEAAVRGCRTVFHLAALIPIPYSYVAPASYISTNVQGTLNVLEACRSHKVSRIVHTSTSEVYGTAQYTPIDEKHPLVGQSPYAASKIGADQIAISYHRSFDLPVSIIRPFNTFGPRQSARAVIPTIVSQVLSGARAIRLGNLTPIRDLTYVKDTVRGFIAVGESEKSLGRVINVGRGEGVTVGELARLVLDICESSADVETEGERLRPANSEVYELVCGNQLAKDLLGWSPQYSLREGLEETIEWFRTRLSLYKPAIYNL